MPTHADPFISQKAALDDGTGDPSENTTMFRPCEADTLVKETDEPD